MIGPFLNGLTGWECSTDWSDQQIKDSCRAFFSRGNPGTIWGMRIQTDFDERDDGMKVDGKTIAGESAGIEIPGNPQNVKRKRRTELASSNVTSQLPT